MKRERPFRGIRRPLASDRLQSSSGRGRRRDFTFVLRRDNEEREATFYALSRIAAFRLARAWASEHGWTLEESQP